MSLHSIAYCQLQLLTFSELTILPSINSKLIPPHIAKQMEAAKNNDTNNLDAPENPLGATAMPWFYFFNNARAFSISVNSAVIKSEANSCAHCPNLQDVFISLWLKKYLGQSLGQYIRNYIPARSPYMV